MQYAVNSSEVSAPVAPKQDSSAADRCASTCTWQQDVTAGVKRILQNIPNKVVHLIIHTDFSSDWSSKADFSTLNWFMTVLSYAKHAIPLNQKRFRQIDNEQHNSHTDPCNFISLSTQYNLILRLSCRLSNSSTKSSKYILSVRTLSTENKSTSDVSMQTGAHGKM